MPNNKKRGRPPLARAGFSVVGVSQYDYVNVSMADPVEFRVYSLPYNYSATQLKLGDLMVLDLREDCDSSPPSTVKIRFYRGKWFEEKIYLEFLADDTRSGRRTRHTLYMTTTQKTVAQVMGSDRLVQRLFPGASVHMRELYLSPQYAVFQIESLS